MASIVPFWLLIWTHGGCTWNSCSVTALTWGEKKPKPGTGIFELSVICTIDPSATLVIDPSAGNNSVPLAGNNPTNTIANTIAPSVGNNSGIFCMADMSKKVQVEALVFFKNNLTPCCLFCYRDTSPNQWHLLRIWNHSADKGHHLFILNFLLLVTIAWAFSSAKQSIWKKQFCSEYNLWGASPSRGRDESTETECLYSKHSSPKARFLIKEISRLGFPAATNQSKTSVSHPGSFL